MTDEELAEAKCLTSHPRRVCRKGHIITSSAGWAALAKVTQCSAVLPWPGGEPCGAEMLRGWYLAAEGVEVPQVIEAIVAEVEHLREHPLAGLRSVERPGAFEGYYDQE